MPRKERHVVPNEDKGGWDSKREKEGLRLNPFLNNKRIRNIISLGNESFSINKLKLGNN